MRSGIKLKLCTAEYLAFQMLGIWKISYRKKKKRSTLELFTKNIYINELQQTR